MKKIAVTMLGLLLLSSTVFAASNDALSVDGVLTVGGANLASGTPSKALTIGLSPKVIGRYVNTDAVTEITAQWYGIATVHPGGNVGYGTAQDVNNIYMIAFKTGDVTTTVTDLVQTTKNEVAADATDAEIAAATAASWVGQGWALTAPN
jgi:hypothetical protein